MQIEMCSLVGDYTDLHLCPVSGTYKELIMNSLVLSVASKHAMNK